MSLLSFYDAIVARMMLHPDGEHKQTPVYTPLTSAASERQIKIGPLRQGSPPPRRVKPCLKAKISFFYPSTDMC